jgi:hypothetical protein
MNIKISKLTTVSFAAMAALTVLQYLTYRGSTPFFKSPWIWYLNGASNSTLVIDGLIFLILGILVLSGFFYFQEHSKISVKNILLLIIFALVIKPVGSSDFAYFLSVGKIASENKNIYLETWRIESFGEPKGGENAGLRSGLTYGPLTVPLFKVFYRWSGGNLIYFSLLMKFFNLLGIYLAAVVLIKIKKYFGQQFDQKTMLYILLSTPLILFEAVINGHFDVWWILFVLLAIYAAVKNLWQYALLLLFISIWIKFVPIIVLPIFLALFISRLDRKNLVSNLNKMFIGVLITIPVSVISWSGLWSGFRVFSSLFGQARWISMSIYHVIYNTANIFFDPTADFIRFNIIMFCSTLFLLALAIYLVFPIISKFTVAIFHRTSIDDKYFIKTIFVAFTVYLLLLQKGIWSWYYIWPFMFGFLIADFEASKHFKKLFVYITTVPLAFYLLVYFFIFILRVSTFTEYYLYVLAMASINIIPIYYLLRWRKTNFS